MHMATRTKQWTLEEVHSLPEGLSSAIRDAVRGLRGRAAPIGSLGLQQVHTRR
jgi:hypothetical protein